MAVRASLMARVGGFRVDLGRRGRSLLGQEQAEFFARTRAAGARGLYVPTMKVWHHVPAERLRRRYFIRWWYWKGIAHARWQGAARSGIPRWVPGEALRAGVRELRAQLRRDDAATQLLPALRVAYLAGYALESRRRRAEVPRPDSKSPARLTAPTPIPGASSASTLEGPSAAIADACDVSIIIGTFNRCEQLPTAVAACLNQVTAATYEVVVVDNNSTDGTRAWVEAQIAGGADRLRYVFEPRQGLPNARNAGILNARGRIVAFTDDDCVVASDWVDAIARTLAARPDVDVIGGKVLPRWPPRIPSWFSRLQWAPLALQDKGDAPLVIDASNAAPCLIGASFAFRREVFERIGLFDPSYTRAQDRELQLRLWEAGGRGLYVPDMQVSVDVPEERLTRKYFRHWYARSGCYASRMRLLDVIDRDGRLISADAKPPRAVLGCPGYVFRGALEHAREYLKATARRDEPTAFYHENRVRFLVSYARERIAGRWRRQDPPGAPPATVVPRSYV